MDKRKVSNYRLWLYPHVSNSVIKREQYDEMLERGGDKKFFVVY